MDLLATYEREIAKKPENLAKFYVVLATAIAVLFVFFGIRPLAITTSQNYALFTELKEIRNALNSKIQTIDTETEKLSEYSSKVDLLYKKIPESQMLESYLSEIVLGAASEGFALQRFRQQENTNEAFSLELEFLGNINSLSNLVEIVESTDRFASINSVRTEESDTSTSIRLDVTIYARN